MNKYVSLVIDCSYLPLPTEQYFLLEQSTLLFSVITTLQVPTFFHTILILQTYTTNTPPTCIMSTPNIPSPSPGSQTQYDIMEMPEFEDEIDDIFHEIILWF